VCVCVWWMIRLDADDLEKTAMPRVVVTLNHWKVLRNMLTVRHYTFFTSLHMQLAFHDTDTDILATVSVSASWKAVL